MSVDTEVCHNLVTVFTIKSFISCSLHSWHQSKQAYKSEHNYIDKYQLVSNLMTDVKHVDIDYSIFMQDYFQLAFTLYKMFSVIAWQSRQLIKPDVVNLHTSRWILGGRVSQAKLCQAIARDRTLKAPLTLVINHEWMKNKSDKTCDE